MSLIDMKNISHKISGYAYSLFPYQILHVLVHRSRGSSDSMQTRLRAGRPGFDTRLGRPDRHWDQHSLLT